MGRLSGEKRRIAQLSAICVSIIGLALIGAGGVSLILDQETRAAEENIDPATFNFSVTLTPTPHKAFAQPTQATAQATQAKVKPGEIVSHYLPLTSGQGNTPVTSPTQSNSLLAVPSPVPTPTPTPVPLPAEIPTRIVVPAIKLDAPITPVVLLYKQGDPAAQWQVPDEREAGWQDTSAKLGEIGNLVLDGHHNINGRVFERLKDLKPGDSIIIYGETRVITYSLVMRTLLLERGQPLQVLLQHAKFIESTPDQRLTLVTCWPPTDYSHRLILVARPVQENMLSNRDSDTNDQYRSGPQ